MANLFEKELGIPLPQCCSHGDCCKGASPSTPYHQLLVRAVDGDEFARGFFSIMVPYQNHQDAEHIVPGLVQRTLAAAKKQADVFQSDEDIVFYHCRYLTADNKCGVWEDRPQFCRDYPDTPFVVMAPGCAFEPWAKACKQKYNAMTDEVAKLKELKQELAALHAIQTQSNPETRLETGSIQPVSPTPIGQDTEQLSLVLSMTDLYLASPFASFYFGVGV
jgi:Fe-S-cluster containining protein